jgi:hypothetical protein
VARYGSIKKEKKMAYKLLGDIIENPTNDNIGSANLVYISAGSATEAILEKADGSTLIGRIKMASGQSITLVKEATDKITCPNSSCTPIAYHW